VGVPVAAAVCGALFTIAGVIAGERDLRLFKEQEEVRACVVAGEHVHACVCVLILWFCVVSVYD